jgi:competence transcription factor ComK
LILYPIFDIFLFPSCSDKFQIISVWIEKNKKKEVHHEKTKRTAI